MPNTPTARRTTAGDGTLTIEVANLDPATAERLATLLGAALDLDVEDATTAKPTTKLAARMTPADLDAEAAHLRAARTDAALDEWERTGEVTR